MAFKLGEAFIQLNTRGMAAVQTQIQGLKSRIGSWLGIAGAGGAVYAFYRALKGGVNQALEAQMANAILEYRLKTLGMGATGAAARLSDYADKLEKLTAFHDEETKAAMVTLLNFGLTEDQVTRMIPRIMDLARMQQLLGRGQQDLSAIAQNVGRAVHGQTTVLERYDIVLKTAKGTTGGFEVVLSALNKTAGDVARTFGETVPGEIEKAKTAYEEFWKRQGEAMTRNVMFWVAPKTLADIWEAEHREIQSSIVGLTQISKLLRDIRTIEKEIAEEREHPWMSEKARALDASYLAGLKSELRRLRGAPTAAAPTGEWQGRGWRRTEEGRGPGGQYSNWVFDPGKWVEYQKRVEDNSAALRANTAALELARTAGEYGN